MTLVEDVNTNEFNEIASNYLEEFQDKETRHIYVDEFLNSKIATQIKVLREQRGWTQAELAEKAGMKQERISVLEDVNYSAWTLNILRRLAEAFDLRINLTFEDFGSFLIEFTKFGKTSLEKCSFENDPIFNNKKKGNKLELTLKPKFDPYSRMERRTKFKLLQGKNASTLQQPLFRPHSVEGNKNKDKTKESAYQEVELKENKRRNLSVPAFSTAKIASAK